jgi:hypothetical protein
MKDPFVTPALMKDPFVMPTLMKDPFVMPTLMKDPFVMPTLMKDPFINTERAPQTRVVGASPQTPECCLPSRRPGVARSRRVKGPEKSSPKRHWRMGPLDAV